MSETEIITDSINSTNNEPTQQQIELKLRIWPELTGEELKTYYNEIQMKKVFGFLILSVLNLFLQD